MFPGRGGCYAQALMNNLPPSTILPEPKGALPPLNTYKECVNEEKPNGGYIPGYRTKPKCTPQILIDRYMQGEANPISLLHQLSQILQYQLEIKETGGTENIPGFYFAFCVIIDGFEYKTGVGITKKDAKTNAAKLALEELLPTLGNYTSVLPDKSDVPPQLPVKEEPIRSHVSCRAIRERKNPVNVQIPHTVRDQLTRLLHSHPEFSNCAGTTAAFVIQSAAGCDVIAFGTGNYNTRENTYSNGRTVHDSHAVVTARRSLMRFLYRHLLIFFSKTANLAEKSIFQLNSSSGLLSLKSGITLHLYVNQLPKGVAQIPANLRLNPRSISTWQDNNEISLHLSVEGKVFSVFSSALEHATSKVVSMSATDKITQWQVLGYQGALLSHFIEPVYVQNVLIGDSGCKDIRGMEISVSQRVEGITSLLPLYYCMERPHISLVPSVAACPADGSQLTHGINWSEGDSSLEVVDGLEGKTIEESPFKSGPALASRLCKAAMFHRFKLVAKEAQRENLLSTSSYREAKLPVDLRNLCVSGEGFHSQAVCGSPMSA
uniref:Adenosine deaminase domain containing 1 (testis-specific) n=1 Tax=Neogobius melanostomus TaxID=47308 RepID=A0A8C6WGT7_9GOBI